MLYLSYRTRLIIYSILLMLFLSGTLVYSYKYVHNVIIEEADNHLIRLKQLLNGHLQAERNELLRYATILAKDLRVKEYMYVVTSIGGDSKPLSTLYEREFEWLPIDRKLILDADNHILVGNQNTDLAIAIRNSLDTKQQGIFYFQGKTGLEVVAVTPIRYRNSLLGRVAVSHFLNQDWLDKNRRITEGEFFLIHNDNIINSSLSSVGNVKLQLGQNRIISNNVPYRVYQIDLPGNNTNKPTLWFGLAENDITAKLDHHRRFMLTLVGAGIAGILLLGLIIIRNFSRPLSQIIQATRQVADGRIPVINKLKVTNEFTELSNHFADMLQALRDQQDEIELTQARLEESAITDSLTGVYNRRYLQEMFPKLLAQAERENLSLYGSLLDLDLFKQINDTHGHVAGDACLIAFAEQLRNLSRTSDFLFRLGGEEFLILSSHKNIIEAQRFADKLRDKIERTPIHYEDNLINLTVSGGVSYANSGNSAESTLNQMLSRADIALYKAKHAGRNRICISTDPEDTGIHSKPEHQYRA